ncbi:MAG: gamma-glutamylcyclotransferase family protein [Gemmatimonadaceae bacterium]
MPLLFSYGTLQQPDVQLSTFGRLLEGHADELIGFEQGLFEINDPEFVATSGKAFHAIVKYNGRSDNRVPGTVFEVSDAELASADEYEPAGYWRVSTTLASGKRAWVYTDAQRMPNETDIT